MPEFMTVMALLFAAYFFVPSTWYAKYSTKSEFAFFSTAQSAEMVAVTGLPEDSMLRRHYITNVRSEIESELPPRPTDFNLRRHHDSLVAAQLAKRLQA